MKGLIPTPCVRMTKDKKDDCRKPNIKCSSVEQGLQPKPRPKPALVEEEPELKADWQETQIRKHASGLCYQSEKLVLFKRCEEALEFFEIVECEGDYVVDSSRYDSLVKVCIGLKSIRVVKRVYNYMVESGLSQINI